MDEVFPGPFWGPYRNPVRLIHRGPWSDTVEAMCGDAAPRRAAIKLATVAGRSGLVERWTRAAVAVGRRLNHPHVVRYFDVEVEGGWFYAERPYIDGVDLGTALRLGERAPIEVACAIGAAVAGAVAAAHGAGLLARRLAPSHVLAGRQGEVGVLHVGLPSGPKRSDPSRPSPADPETAYVAPEVFSGGEPGTAADVYSAAAVVYALLEGGPPAPRGHPLARVLVRKGALAVEPETMALPGAPALSPVLGAALGVSLRARPGAAELADALTSRAERPSALAAWTRSLLGTASMPPPG